MSSQLQSLFRVHYYNKNYGKFQMLSSQQAMHAKKLPKCFGGAQSIWCHRINQISTYMILQKLRLRFWENSIAVWLLLGIFEKKCLNARGFVQEYLSSCSGYGPGRSIKRCGKSSKNYFFQKLWYKFI